MPEASEIIYGDNWPRLTRVISDIQGGLWPRMGEDKPSLHEIRMLLWALAEHPDLYRKVRLAVRLIRERTPEEEG